MHEVKKLAVIGDPIAHSLSPLLQNTMLQILGMPYIYEACRVPIAGLNDWVHRVRNGEFAGFNATMPHKLHLIPFMDTMTEQANYFGAVNSVRNDGGVLTGHNTDGDGFARMLAEYGIRFSGARVTVLGAGGAAGAIIRKAVQDGALRVTVMNRTLAKAEALCAEHPTVLTARSLRQELPVDTEILINTIPVWNDLDCGFVKNLSNHCSVFDILYAPPKTPLLLAAEERGLQAVNGLGMLIHQAILALEFFTNVSIDAEGMAKILYKTVQDL